MLSYADGHRGPALRLELFTSDVDADLRPCQAHYLDGVRVHRL